MANKVYDNFYLSNEIEDKYKSHLDLQQFCKIDNNLEGTAGMTRKINVYTATEGTEKLALGAGNSKSISVSHTSKDYKILLAQNRFEYHDEEALTDDTLVPAGINYMASDLFNTVNADIYAEFSKTSKKVDAEKFDFNAIVDALAVLNIEDSGKKDQDMVAFAFVSPKDIAELRKNLKDDLKYIEGFVRHGYIGTVAGVNIYTKKDAKEGTIVVATKDAVTLFNKKGTEIEQGRDGNIRKNTIYSRKYYLAALTNETKAVKIEKNHQENN